MPATGWPMPQRMFWIASASPNTSRSQPFACDCGVKNRPSVERGPKLSMEMRQPHSTITTGVRQPIVATAEVEEDEEEDEIAMTANLCNRTNDLRQCGGRSPIQISKSLTNVRASLRT